MYSSENTTISAPCSRRCRPGGPDAVAIAGNVADDAVNLGEADGQAVQGLGSIWLMAVDLARAGRGCNGRLIVCIMSVSQTR